MLIFFPKTCSFSNANYYQVSNKVFELRKHLNIFMFILNLPEENLNLITHNVKGVWVVFEETKVY